MGRYAIVDSAGLVDNVILWDPDADLTLDDAYELVELGDETRVSPGDTITPDGAVSPAEPSEPGPDTMISTADKLDALLDVLVATKTIDQDTADAIAVGDAVTAELDPKG